ncbi:bifunctional diaminohydroxyphosphoribosylaminopyrimidine deaminase/5-amino-6-(5-phosphoribosylamino)uracil reductase RibD [Pusillimonas sp. CC-YST705]|uniref:Riboflavin biosynthesis protein RibD n=2 Tax=Mesopusillimonas faecipullorum TaxID=2755040 RepID=A0ABS8CDG8_9BURK|nr:bifunctional diaminohydroxyphosphoribosylaminopyrimidine deaminase/5-amino-6-(5-phosphoribosylamino)uracil reductase RibD [Mesopusillimonas faecipullorum]
MRQAIALSRESLFLTTPNPRVACLIVREGKLLASGVTQRAGQAHAEVMALRDASQQGLDVAGATFYVTLEPCNHHGRTPPCVDALLSARPARVVVAMQDPNPLVAGKGLARLRAAGIQVETGVCAEEALAVNPGFIARMTRGTPWVWLKTAASLDGHTALHNGASKWITSSAARQDGQHWRARSCVVLTGIGTVLADDPQLNVRDIATPRQPVRAVIDSQLRISPTARMLDGEPVWVFTTRNDPDKAARLAERNAQVIVLPAHNHRVHLPALMQWLGQHDINEVHVEAGPILNGALLQAGCADALLVYLAPLLLGDARPMFDLPALKSLGDAHAFEFTDMARVGADLRVCAQNKENWQALLAAVQPRPSV